MLLVLQVHGHKSIKEQFNEVIRIHRLGTLNVFTKFHGICPIVIVYM